MNNDTVAVLMATHNGEAYLSSQIESILSQTYSDWTLTISDDLSSDQTRDIIKRYAFGNSKIDLLDVANEPLGAKANFARLIRQRSDARYAMFCDQDDVWDTNKIELTMREMQRLEKQHGSEVPLLVFTDMRVVDSNQKQIDASFEAYSRLDPSRVEFNQLLAQSVAAGCTMMANQPLLVLFNETENLEMVIMHDWWLSLIASAFGFIGHVDEATSSYRQHDSNAIGASKYSLKRAVRSIGNMTQRIQKTITQAQLFERIYGSKLDSESLRLLKKYISIVNTANPAKRLFLLNRSGALKYGARKIGQILAVLFLSKSNPC